MGILVVGSGGREHALAWKLAQDSEVFVSPGNAGIAKDAECVAVGALDAVGLEELCRERKPELVVIGPEDPLIAGVADRLRVAGYSVFGPGKDGAELEGSKAYSKELMLEAGIPTARFGTFDSPDAAKEFAFHLAQEGVGLVVKASGNALGKGVVIPNGPEDAAEIIDRMLLAREFGAAGDIVVVEERLYGFEFSLLSLCNEHGFVSLPVAQDYKRAHDGDQGPNTGGMGTYSPVGAVPADLVREAEDRAVRPMLEALKRQGITYRGTLFSGFMVQNGKPYCLEYNVRFGDPETQTLMRRLGGGFGDALKAVADGKPISEIEVLDNHAVTVVMASGGYPGSYEKGKPISIPNDLPDEVKVFHAGTQSADGRLVTSGGRVLGVSATGDTLMEARETAYAACGLIHIDGGFYRHDIAASPV